MGNTTKLSVALQRLKERGVISKEAHRELSKAIKEIDHGLAVRNSKKTRAAVDRYAKLLLHHLEER